VIGRLLVALGGLDLLLFEEALRVFPERRGDRQLLDQLAGSRSSGYTVLSVRGR